MRVAMVLGLCVSAYLALAYLVLPALWSHYEHQPGLRGRPMTTVTAEGIPGGPLNIGLVGSRDDVVRAWGLAGWYPADPITLKTSLEIAESVLLHRQYMDAPVSNLFYEGRQQDLAFEKPVGGSADQRHHVRLWMTLKNGEEGGRSGSVPRPLIEASASAVTLVRSPTTSRPILMQNAI